MTITEAILAITIVTILGILSYELSVKYEADIFCGTKNSQTCPKPINNDCSSIQIPKKDIYKKF